MSTAGVVAVRLALGVAADGGGSVGYGRGPNFPGWSDTTIYPDQPFAEDIPQLPTRDAADYGWSAGGGGTMWNNMSYETVETPLGSKRVLKIRYPGATTNITALDQVTPAHPLGNGELFGVGIRITGTWTGTLSFERSANGVDGWEAHTVLLASTESAFGTSTTSNNVFWARHSTDSFFRVRASSWTSGTAVVQVGQEGGSSPAKFSMGRLSGSPTRLYMRYLTRLPENLTLNGNTGMKMLFFSQEQGNNHYINWGGESGVEPVVSTQGGNGNASTSNSITTPLGEWADVEVELHTGTAGGNDGIARVWVNGQESAEKTDMPFFAAATTPRWTEINFDATYGGGRNPPPVNMFPQIAYVYMESAA